MGIDVALQRDPFSAVTVGRDRSNPRRLIVGEVAAWQPRKPRNADDLAAAAEEICTNAIELGQRYGVHTVVCDQHLNAITVDRLQRGGLHTVSRPLTRTSKLQAFTQLRSVLYTGELELPADPDLAAELKQIRVKHAGADSQLITPRTPRHHCDRAVALALATAEMAQLAWVGGELGGGRWRGLGLATLDRRRL